MPLKDYDILFKLSCSDSFFKYLSTVVHKESKISFGTVRNKQPYFIIIIIIIANNNR